MSSPGEDRAWIVTQFVDKHGKILEKTSNPVHSILGMEWENGDLYARFRVMSAAQGNGSYQVQVADRGKEVLKVYGSFISTPNSVTVKTYEPGAWEDVFVL